MDDQEQSYWRKCSSCKNPLNYNSRYYSCSVSTCNGQRTGYVFCSVPCFERHLPGARHKDAAAIEGRTPNSPDQPQAAQRRAIPSVNQSIGVAKSAVQTPQSTEVLVIASRLKDYIHAKSDFNTAASVLDALSQHLRVICDRAIDNARAEGRKTVMDRDFSFLKNQR